MGHTPGPWIPSAYEGGWDCVRDATNQGIVCKLSENNPANMYLIAAAPDLLAALEAIVAREQGEFDNPHLLAHGPLSSKSEDILAIARAIIAQAKGAS